MWPFDYFRDDSEPKEYELKRIKWLEEYDYEYTVRRERIVWSGGAEREVGYCPERTREYGGHRAQTLWNQDGKVVLEIEETPAYRETIDEATKTETRTATRRAWITGDIPGDAEDTGKRKTVVEVPDDE